MMKVLAMASTPMTVVDCKIPMRLSLVKNASGFRTLKITISAIKLAKASSICLAWLSTWVPGVVSKGSAGRAGVDMAWVTLVNV